jgi:hypothetical protein
MAEGSGKQRRESFHFFEKGWEMWKAKEGIVPLPRGKKGLVECKCLVRQSTAKFNTPIKIKKYAK